MSECLENVPLYIIWPLQDGVNKWNLVSILLSVISLLRVHPQVCACAWLCFGDQVQRLENLIRYRWSYRKMCALRTESVLVSSVGYCDRCALWRRIRVWALNSLSLQVPIARVLQVSRFLSGSAISRLVTVNRTTRNTSLGGYVTESAGNSCSFVI